MIMTSIIEKRIALKAAAEALAKEVKELDAQIVAMMGGHDEMFIDGFAVTNKIVIRKEHVVKESIFAVLKIKIDPTVTVTV